METFDEYCARLKVTEAQRPAAFADFMNAQFRLMNNDVD